MRCSFLFLAPLLFISSYCLAMPYVSVPAENVEAGFVCSSGYCPHGINGICYQFEKTVSLPSEPNSLFQELVVGEVSFEAVALGEDQDISKPEVHCTIEESLRSLFLINASCLPSLSDEEVQKRKEAFMNYCMYGQAIKPEDPEKGTGFYGSCSSALPFIDPRIVHDKARAFCEAEYNLSHEWQCECYAHEKECNDTFCDCGSECYRKFKKDQSQYESCTKKCSEERDSCTKKKKGCDTKLCLKYRELKNRGIAECAKIAIPNIF